MAGQIINRGKGGWLVRVYLGTDLGAGKPGNSSGPLAGSTARSFLLGGLSAFF